MNDFIKGYDLSHWNNIATSSLDKKEWALDWYKLKQEIDFLILKLGGSEARKTPKNPNGFEQDKTFLRRQWCCRKFHIPFGCYWFAGKDSTSEQSGMNDAEKAVEMLCNSMGLTKSELREYIRLGVWIDIEAPVPANRKLDVTRYAIAFMRIINGYGLNTGIYGSDVATFVNRVNPDLIRRECPYAGFWVARYGKNPPKVIDYWSIWQFTSKGSSEVVQGNIDVNYMRTN